MPKPPLGIALVACIAGSQLAIFATTGSFAPAPALGATEKTTDASPSAKPVLRTAIHFPMATAHSPSRAYPVMVPGHMANMEVTPVMGVTVRFARVWAQLDAAVNDSRYILRCRKLGTRARTASRYARSSVARTIPSPSDACATTSPHGSATSDFPYVCRPRGCVPHCAGATT